MRPVSDKALQDLVGPLDTGTHDSGLIQSMHRVWAIPLKQLTLGDLRLVIGQKRGLPYLIPLALAHLEQHPLAEATYYHGDLLRMVAQVDVAFWRQHPHLQRQLQVALDRALSMIHKKSVPEDLEPELRSALAMARHSV